MTSYRVLYERDRVGAWLARVPSVPGCHTYGRTLEQARARIREALGLWIDDAPRARLVDVVRLPASARRTVARARRARRLAEARHAVAQASLARAAAELTRSAGLSLRDAGELLGLSRQRVQQLLHATPRQKRRP